MQAQSSSSVGVKVWVEYRGRDLSNCSSPHRPVVTFLFLEWEDRSLCYRGEGLEYSLIVELPWSKAFPDCSTHAES